MHAYDLLLLRRVLSDAARATIPFARRTTSLVREKRQ
jgi:hypothetical protein